MDGPDNVLASKVVALQILVRGLYHERFSHADDPVGEARQFGERLSTKLAKTMSTDVAGQQAAMLLTTEIEAFFDQLAGEMERSGQYRGPSGG